MKKLAKSIKRKSLSTEELSELLYWLFIREDYNIVDISNLDFRKYKCDVCIDHLKVDGTLYQCDHEVTGDLWQCGHEVGLNLHQDEQLVKGNLYQEKQTTVVGSVYQDKE